MRDLLAASIWTDVTSVMNLGILAGALAAAAVGGRFRLALRLSRSEIGTAVVGGLLLGYGARLAYGCNIGALFSGVASGSAHGWLWLVGAFAGFWLAERLCPVHAHRCQPKRPCDTPSATTSLDLIPGCPGLEDRAVGQVGRARSNLGDRGRPPPCAGRDRL